MSQKDRVTAAFVHGFTLNQLADIALCIATEHGFKDASPAEDIALMHSELSEALEDIRAGLPLDQIHYTAKVKMYGTRMDMATGKLIQSETEEEIKAEGFVYQPSIEAPTFNKPCGVPSEMADIMIRVLHFCGKHKIDLDKAVAEKMQYNDARPFMHGGKKL